MNQSSYNPEPPAGVPAAAPSVLVRAGRFFFAWRNLLFTAVLVALLGGLRPVLFLGSRHASEWLDGFGILLALAGQSLRAVVMGTTRIQHGGRQARVFAQQLATTGLFNHVRNPLYLGNFLVLFGLFVIHNHPWVYVVGSAFFLFAYRAIVAAEEAYLQERFGADYRDYCRRVPRWLPQLRGLWHSLDGLQFNWWRVAVKEYTSIYTGVSGILFLLAVKTWLTQPSPERGSRLLVLAGAFLGLTLAWAVIRYAKKTERARRRRSLAWQASS